MAAIISTTSINDKRNVNLISSRTRSLPRREKETAYSAVTDEHDGPLMNPDDSKMTHVKRTPMIELHVKVFKETLLECCLRAIVETEFVN